MTERQHKIRNITATAFLCAAVGLAFGLVMLNMFMGCEPNVPDTCTWPWQ